MTAKKQNWKEEAWEEFLLKFWDNRDAEIDSIEYTKEDLEEILGKYKKSGQGEIRIFHYGHENLEAVKKRNICKIPLSRTKWKIIKSSPPLEFNEPNETFIFNNSVLLTDGMFAGIKDSLSLQSNPGETTLLSIANYIGLIADFYNLSEKGVLFTGGRQKAGINLDINGKIVDMKKAQIEIDGGFEWQETVVITEMKSSFTQTAFDTNQALIPMLKWKDLLSHKKVKSLVLLAETKNNSIEYWAYDLIEDGANKMSINKRKKYILNIKN